MTLTAQQLGVFMRIEERPTNGLGLLYRAGRDGTFTRYFF